MPGRPMQCMSQNPTTELLRRISTPWFSWFGSPLAMP
jgi:hypothetical protein